MADVLARVRPTFVEKVSTQMINQLLDDILLDGIINEMEKESIIEENSIRSDKARRLIDSVKKKGERASKKLIAHIQRRDPELSAELGLSCGQPAPPAAEPQMDQNLSIDAFWREKQNDKNVYPGTKNAISNRVALVITNITFTNQLLNRKGAEKDEDNMEILLKGLGYEVVKHRNLTGKAIEDAITDFSKHPKLKDTDSVVVVIMSHGKLGAVCGVNSQSEVSGDDNFSLDNIYIHLGPKNCPALLDKPKIILIQACRGEEKGGVILADNLYLAENPAMGDDANIEDDNLRVVHKEKDFISLLCCTPGTVAYREPSRGSFLIQVLVDVFNGSAARDDLEELFRKVMCRFEDLPIGNRRQMPTKERCTLTKHFYFYPGLV